MDDTDFNPIFSKNLSKNPHKLSDYTPLKDHNDLQKSVAKMQKDLETQIIMNNNNANKTIGGAQSYLQSQINNLKYHKSSAEDLSWTQNNIKKIQSGLQGEIVQDNTNLQKAIGNAQNYLQNQINNKCTWDSMNWIRETLIPQDIKGLQTQIDNKCDWKSVNWIRQNFVPNIQSALQDQINTKCDWKSVNWIRSDYNSKIDSLQEQINAIKNG